MKIEKLLVHTSTRTVYDFFHNPYNAQSSLITETIDNDNLCVIHSCHSFAINFCCGIIFTIYRLLRAVLSARRIMSGSMEQDIKPASVYFISSRSAFSSHITRSINDSIMKCNCGGMRDCEIKLVRDGVIELNIYTVCDNRHIYIDVKYV